MKFSFVEFSCRIQLDGTKLREIFLLILLVFVSSTISTRSLRSLVEIIVETNTRIMRSKISGNFVPSRCITNENFETGPAQICADLLEIRIDKKKIK
jgi:hypothetical protein